MRASRLLSILIAIQLDGRVTAEDLAARFEVSKRTIYRDIDDLSSAGIPIYAEKGPGGGFSLLEGYRTRLTGLTPAEIDAVLLLGLPGPARDLGLGEPALSARGKLVASLPGQAGDDARRVGDRFHLDPVDWYRRIAAPVHLKAAASGVWQQHRISIAYESWKANVHRTLDPLGLVLKAGQWYLIGRCDGKIRTFRVSRITDLQSTDVKFERPHDFDLATHWKREVERFENSLWVERAVIRFSPAALDHLHRLGADAAEIVLATVPDRKGDRIADIPLEAYGSSVPQLFSFGSSIEVISPKRLRQAMFDAAHTLTILYTD